MTKTTTKGQETKSRTTKRKESLIFKILELLTCLMAVFEILVANTQVFVTEVRLMKYNLCTQDYIDSGFTGASDETMEQMFSERRKLYNSDNPIVWVAANAPTFVKVIFLILSVRIYYVVGKYCIRSGIEKIRRTKK